MFLENERKQFSIISGVAKPLEMNSRQQDGQNGRWTQPPTEISAPSNPPRAERSGFASSPFNSAAMGNKKSKRVGGNATAQATLLGDDMPPKKRQRTTRSMAQERGSSPYVMGKGTSPRVFGNASRNMAQSGSGVINLESDEDIGVPVSNTPDQIDLFKAPTSSKKSIKRRSPATQEDSERDKDFDVNISARKRLISVPDGEDTRALAMRLGSHEDASDLISDFTPPPQVDQPQPGFVHTKIQDFERMQNGGKRETEKAKSGPTPRLDLRQLTVKPVKKNMKPKNPVPGKLRDAEATMSTQFTNSAKSVNGPRSGTKQLGHLWIKGWFCGTERRSAESRCVTWDENTLYVRESKMVLLWLAPRTDIRQVEFSADKTETVIFAVQTSRPEEDYIDTRDTNRFTMGDRHRGNVVFTFEKPAYNTFYSLVQWMKKHKVDTHGLRGDAWRSRWKQAMNQSDLEDLTLGRKVEQEAGSQLARNITVKRLAQDIEDDTTFLEDARSMGVPAFSSRSVSRAAEDQEDGLDRMIRPRRSARGHNTSKVRKSPAPDPDEVILCYPQGVTGAVNVTNGDYKRLEPGEFLNDTLIEFGLKRWLKKIEEDNPELAKQIHVFSSFFYKKLNKRNFEEGYESVRKWTAKINLFSKKYIVVPINENLHWYLVIIYHPEHMLNPSQSPIQSPITRARRGSPVPRKSPKKSLSSKTNPSRSSHPHSAAAAEPPSTISYTPASPSSPRSEAEVEEAIMNGISSGVCSITIEPLDTLSGSRAASMPIDAPSHDQLGGMTTTSDSMTSITMDVDPQTNTFCDELLMTTLSFDSRHDDTATLYSTGVDDADLSLGTNKNTSHDLFSGHVDPHNFYGKPSTVALGKQKAIPNQADLSQDDSPVIVEVDDPSPSEHTTYIFSFDSLGSRHPQAIRQLTRYLQKEASDKLGKENTGHVVGMQAHVPVQPNFCDCGLFLLHFASTFMSDPQKYSQMIIARTGKATRPTLQDDWRSELTLDMRERLRSDIEQLSIEWKKYRGEKERGVAGFQTIDSSDDEIDIVETVPAVSATKAGKGKTSKPMRHRG